jgi:hypothetical protein
LYDRGNTSFYCKPVNRVGEWFGEREIVLDLRHVNTFVDKTKGKIWGCKGSYGYILIVIDFSTKCACFKDDILFFKIIGVGKVSNGILYPKLMTFILKSLAKRTFFPK